MLLQAKYFVKSGRKECKQMKKIIAAFLVFVIVLFSSVVLSAADSTAEPLSDNIVYKGTPAKITEDGIIDPVWNNVTEYKLENWLPADQNRIRPGLSVSFKHIWDEDNFYYLVKIVGDKDVFVDGTELTGSYYADKTNLLLVVPETDANSFDGRNSDVYVRIHRDNPKTAPEGGEWETSEWVMPATWGSQSLTDSSLEVIPRFMCRRLYLGRIRILLLTALR